VDPASIAAALVGAQAGQTQLAIAAKILKINADQSASFAQVIATAAENSTQAASVGPGIGQNLDIRA
jgi:hypothetical protein